jgi:catechol 2,3-dioxygenase
MAPPAKRHEGGTVSVTTEGIFGGRGELEPALPGTYGRAPSGHRLPDTTRLGPVRLQVTDLARSVAFYRDALGLEVVGAGDDVVSASGSEAVALRAGERTLVELRSDAHTVSGARRGRLGLYHFALLLPDRASLGRLVRHLSERGVALGAGDHLVSEAFYLSDPDGLGIEVYVDRPRSAWRRAGRELVMATDPVDVDSVIAAGEGEPWRGMPDGSRVGHVHLHVADIERARAFYFEGLGFDQTVWSYPGALFLGAGGYHHHVGVNTWAGPAATPPRDDEARLLEWTMEVPEAGALERVADALAAAGQAVGRSDGEVAAADPWGTRVRLVVPERPASANSRTGHV